MKITKVGEVYIPTDGSGMEDLKYPLFYIKDKTQDIFVAVKNWEVSRLVEVTKRLLDLDRLRLLNVGESIEIV